MCHGEHDQPGQQRLGLFVPVRFRLLAGRVHHQSLSERGGIFGQVGASRVKPPEGIIGRGGQAGDAEGVEDVNRPEALARLACDLRILTLGVDHQH